MVISVFVLGASIAINSFWYWVYLDSFQGDPKGWYEFAISAIRFEVIAFFVSFWLSLTLGRKKGGVKAIWVFTMLLFVPMFILTFAVIYGDMSVDSNEHTAAAIKLSDADRLYFSVVTFTTLGYGDIQPTIEFRLVAAFQALLGFLFVPIIIAEITNFVYSFQNNTGQ